MKKMTKPELTKRILACILGNLIISLGVAFAKVADLGIDPFNGMCMSVAAFFNIYYPAFTWGFNLVCFVFEIIFGRKYIHIGTFINWFLISYAVSVFLKLHEILGLPTPEGLPLRLVVLVLGLFITSLGLAIYQLADLGIAPYDVLPIMYCDRHPKFPYFWARIILDSLGVLGMVATKSTLIGIGTLFMALGLGPIIHMFTVILEKIFPKAKKTAEAV